VYAGASLTRDHDVTIHDRVVGQGVYRDAEFATSPAYGARLGRYFDSVPFVGLAVDFFTFSPNIRPQAVRRDGCFLVTGCGSFEGRTGRIDIDTRALSLDLMLRLPLFTTADEPHGLLQPYVAALVPDGHLRAVVIASRRAGPTAGLDSSFGDDGPSRLTRDRPPARAGAGRADRGTHPSHDRSSAWP
jgi:hypothetical protein